LIVTAQSDLEKGFSYNALAPTLRGSYYSITSGDNTVTKNKPKPEPKKPAKPANQDSRPAQKKPGKKKKNK
jgi:hypothetical protein